MAGMKRLWHLLIKWVYVLGIGGALAVLGLWIASLGGPGPVASMSLWQMALRCAGFVLALAGILVAYVTLTTPPPRQG